MRRGGMLMRCLGEGGDGDELMDDGSEKRNEGGG